MNGNVVFLIFAIDVICELMSSDMKFLTQQSRIMRQLCQARQKLLHTLLNIQLDYD